MQLEEEAVELGLGKRVGPFQLDRVLRRQHEERTRQRPGGAEQRDVVFLHRLEQGRLRLRRGAVDLVGEQEVREDRPGPERHRPSLGPVLQDVAAEDVARHQVGRELHPAKLDAEELGERLHQGRLADAGDAFEQHMPPAEDGDEHQPVQRRLAQQDAVELFEHLPADVDGVGHLVRLQQGRRFMHGRVGSQG